MKKTMKFHLAGALILFLFFSSFTPMGEITSEYTGSTTVQTCNCKGVVQVRALSNGPGACAVTFKTSKGETAVTALPHVWSAWVTVYEHTGKTDVTIDNDVLCDGGVRTQVKYLR